jgi:uncharacterized protein (DUF488 family)
VRATAPIVWSVGHSTRSASEFRTLLAIHDIELVADVRRYPGSRRLPHFASEALQDDLESAGISYRWLPALGGRRPASKDSVNTGWRHSAFRGYADYTASEEFAEGLMELLMLALGMRTAIMCAEVLWWRCHRRLIADILTWLGIEVRHIVDERTTELHRLAPPARVVGGMLTWSAPDAARSSLSAAS